MILARFPFLMRQSEQGPDQEVKGNHACSRYPSSRRMTGWTAPSWRGPSASGDDVHVSSSARRPAGASVRCMFPRLERDRETRGCLPTLHPFDSEAFSFLLTHCRTPEDAFEEISMTDCGVVCVLLLQDLRDDHRVAIDPANNSPCHVDIHDSQLVAAQADAGHRSRVGHFESLAGLQSPQQESGLKPCLLGEGRRLHFPMQSDKRFVSWVHEKDLMPLLT